MKEYTVILGIFLGILVLISKYVFLYQKHKPGTGFMGTNRFYNYQFYYPFGISNKNIVKLTLDGVNIKYSYARVVKKYEDNEDLIVEIEYWR